MERLSAGWMDGRGRRGGRSKRGLSNCKLSLGGVHRPGVDEQTAVQEAAVIGEESLPPLWYSVSDVSIKVHF